MSEAKLQDSSTVKGYRTLTAGDIERMNRLKGVSRHFCSLLDTERGELLAVRNALVIRFGIISGHTALRAL